jgi:FkbM family methyltransferase
MIYLINYCFLNIVRILNKFGRGISLRKRIFSSQKILEVNFKTDSKFNFIQVGANDGVSFDFLYDFVTKRNSSGIVVEPIQEYFEELVINYKNFPQIIKINKAIHPIDKKIIIYRISHNAMKKYPDWVKGIASLDPKHHLKTNIETKDIIQENVEADSLMNIIIENIKVNQIDYFQIDTEGFDFEVIKGMDFKCFKPLMIKYESVNLSKEDKKDLKLLLKDNGYYLFDEKGDSVAVNLKKIKLI